MLAYICFYKLKSTSYLIKLMFSVCVVLARRRRPRRQTKEEQLYGVFGNFNNDDSDYYKRRSFKRVTSGIQFHSSGIYNVNDDKENTAEDGVGASRSKGDGDEEEDDDGDEEFNDLGVLGT